MSYTEILYQFHDDHSRITFTVPTYIVDMWIEEKTQINTLRRIGYVVSFKEFQK